MLKKTHRATLVGLSLAMVASLGFTGCRVQKTEDGKVPEVQVKEGKLPKYDVDTAKVDVKSEPVNVDVPKVEVKKETETVNVPKVKVTMPPDKPKTDPRPPGR
jgi:hypothetical protein